MKLLLVGNANHQFITNYTRWLKREVNDINVDILSDRPVNIRYEKLYNRIFHINFNSPLFSLISKIKILRRYYRYFKYIKLLEDMSNYDYVHFHFLSVDSVFLTKKIKKYLCAKVIVSIWGSDFYKLKKIEKGYFEDACKVAEKITFTNEQTRNDFKNSLEWDYDNLFVCRFGLAPLEVLKENEKSKDQCKQDLGWNKDKLSVTIGYNSSPAQQHIKIIEQLHNPILKKFKDKIELILPLTYGGDESYKNKIQTILKKSPFEYKVYRDFLTDQEVAEIRQASDIMIQLQVTDQFSGSMQEHIYTGNIVITGSWLPYKTLNDYGVYFLTVDRIVELVDLIPEVIGNVQYFKKKVENNSDAIKRLSSWEINIKDWVSLYN